MTTLGNEISILAVNYLDVYCFDAMALIEFTEA